MQSNHQGLLNTYNGLFHVSGEPGITVFEPRPSPSHFEDIKGDVVFAISGRMLHNYLLPRDCPRVTWYAGEQTIGADKARFLNGTNAKFIITVEWDWYQRIIETPLYCYSFASDNFTLLDECAGYYISYQPEIPLSVTPVNNIMHALQIRNVELRFTPSLVELADEVSKSTLNFSIIRMRNAKR